MKAVLLQPFWTLSARYLGWYPRSLKQQQHKSLCFSFTRHRLSAVNPRGRQAACVLFAHEEHLDRAVALAGCYLSSSESNVRSAARLQRGWGRDKIHRGPQKRSHWWEDRSGRKPGLFTSWQPCSKDVAALNSRWGRSYSTDVLIRGLSGVRGQVLYTVRYIVFMDVALWGVRPGRVTNFNHLQYSFCNGFAVSIGIRMFLIQPFPQHLLSVGLTDNCTITSSVLHTDA